MAGLVLEKDKKIYRNGQPMTAVHLITKGTVLVEFPGGSYFLEKGDVIGVCELCSEVHFLNYTATEETTILSYPVNNTEALEAFLAKHLDIARLFLLSVFRQINLLLEQTSVSDMRCSGLRQNLLTDYSLYQSLSVRYHITLHAAEGFDEITSNLSEEAPDLWLNTYYLGLHNLYSGSSDIFNALLREPGLSIGMLRKGSLDYRKTFSVLEEQSQYYLHLTEMYFNPAGNDLFEMLTSLYYQLGSNNDDTETLLNTIKRIIQDVEQSAGYNEQCASRIKNFQEKVAILSEAENSPQEAKDGLSSAILQELSGSLDTILDYALMEPEFVTSFKENVLKYKSLSDCNDMTDVNIRLRKKITDQFYSLYSAVFERSVTTPYVPIPIKMFLHFGYVDEDLAGTKNSITLYNLACGIDEKQTQFGLYTFYQWLMEIFNGSKMPSRNEFDEDYTDYINKQKQHGYISARDLARMEADPMCKVKYELENLFPQANKMTSGRITTFCPLFCSDNVIKDLKDSMVTVSRVLKAFEYIKSIDYSAFYREALDQDNLETMGKEILHRECLPDIILMPNVGIRGIMWQEIEGRKRTTPGRMLISAFHMEDVTTTLVRLTGEFRWEMCKRVQGSRWNDVSDHSLTSDYFDYVQFFRKNHELSTEAKEKIKNSLQRAKNSFKEMFVRDYMVWVLFEGNGSPRLNKVARRILITYCPFPAELSVTMEQNPLYGELISRQKIHIGQRLHHLDNLRQKLHNNNIPIPASLEEEYAFVQGKTSNNTPRN